MSRIAHHVFFTLSDRSERKIADLVSACQKYLNDHDGVIGFEVGTRERDLDRDVNGDFDVSLHVIFRDRATHDDYQTAPRHLEFIQEQKANWATVQVFDSRLTE